MSVAKQVAPEVNHLRGDGSIVQILGVDYLPGHIDPEKTALCWADERRTYRELRGRALSLAASLRARGLQPGDRVAGHLLNRGETFELYFACAYAGLTFVSVNWRLTARELGMIFDDCRPAVAFTQRDVGPSMSAAAEPRDVPIVVLDDDGSGAAYEEMAAVEPLAAPFDQADPHLILYTSGTTGRPKGVMMAHGSISWFAAQQAAIYPVTRDTVTLVTSPTFNTAGINELVIPTFLVGGAVVVHPSRGWRPERMAALIDEWNVTHTVIYPSMMDPFIDADRAERIELASLRFVLTGGENCPPAVLARFQRRWPQAVLYMGYGATESGIVTLICGDEIGRHPGSTGRPALGMTVRIVDPEGREVGVDEVGEILTTGGSIVTGYWNAPELTAETLRDGWLKTGDLGRRDVDGYLYLEGRSKDLIISKGQNIYPAEIESVLAEHEDLLESAVIGLPDPEWGEVVCAAVVRKPGRDVDAVGVVAFVQERLASYKKPRHVVFLDELPRNAGNKVIKQALDAAARKALGGHGD